MPVRTRGRRYLKFSIRSSQDIDEKEAFEAIQKGVLTLHGIRGLSEIEPTLIEFHPEKQEGILRCSRAHLRDLRASLALITRIGDSNASIQVAKVSGTLKSLRA